MIYSYNQLASTDGWVAETADMVGKVWCGRTPGAMVPMPVVLWCPAGATGSHVQLERPGGALFIGEVDVNVRDVGKA